MSDKVKIESLKKNGKLSMKTMKKTMGASGAVACICFAAAPEQKDLVQNNTLKQTLGDNDAVGCICFAAVPDA